MTEIKHAGPKPSTLRDDTLRRSGARDLSGDNTDGKAFVPPNPGNDILESGTGHDHNLPSTDWLLHAGPSPGRIDRFNEMRVFGLNGKNVFGKARDDNNIRVGHIPASHPNRRVLGNPSIATSDSTYIPSFRIGDPL